MRIRYSPRAVTAYIRSKVQRLEDLPFSAPQTNRPGTRMLPVVRYPYLVFYSVVGDEVVIKHIRHAARQRS